MWEEESIPESPKSGQQTTRWWCLRFPVDFRSALNTGPSRRSRDLPNDAPSAPIEEELTELQQVQHGTRVVGGSRCPHNKAICRRSAGPFGAIEHSFESPDASDNCASCFASIDGPDVEI